MNRKTEKRAKAIKGSQQEQVRPGGNVFERDTPVNRLALRRRLALNLVLQLRELGRYRPLNRSTTAGVVQGRPGVIALEEVLRVRVVNHNEPAGHGVRFQQPPRDGRRR